MGFFFHIAKFDFISKEADALIVKGYSVRKEVSGIIIIFFAF